MGTGTATCGPGTLSQYCLPSNKVYNWEYTIIPSAIAEEEKIILGDADNSGYVDMTDLSMISLHILKETILEGNALKAADVDRNGSVELADLTKVLQYVSKKIPELK